MLKTTQGVSHLDNSEKMPHVQSKRQWISGLAVILTALICLFGFWRLSPGITFVVAVCAFVALLVLFWKAGNDL